MTMSLSPLESPVLREYNTYEEAQRLVDRLSDAGFPVQHVRIVGHDFHSVEQVTGRLTKGRAALLGAGSGAWFGLLIGLLLSLFAVGPGVLMALLGSVLIGGLWGAAFGFAAHWATGGRRDFTSVTAMVAERYTVQVDPAYLDEATKIADRI
jgi:heat induced stress protein YflT